jgi:hypothetical protein
MIAMATMIPTTTTIMMTMGPMTMMTNRTKALPAG